MGTPDYDIIEFSTTDKKVVENFYWEGKKLRASPRQIMDIFGESLIVKGNTYFWAGTLITPEINFPIHFSISNPTVAVGFQENIISRDFRIAAKHRSHGSLICAAINHRIKYPQPEPQY